MGMSSTGYTFNCVSINAGTDHFRTRVEALRMNCRAGPGQPGRRRQYDQNMNHHQTKCAGFVNNEVRIPGI